MRTEVFPKMNRAFSAGNWVPRWVLGRCPRLRAECRAFGAKTWRTRCLCHASANAGSVRSNRLRALEIVGLLLRTRSSDHSPRPSFQECADGHSSWEQQFLSASCETWADIADLYVHPRR